MTLTKELDLHNVRHMEVQSVMDKFLGDHMMNGTCLLYTSPSPRD